MKEVMCVGLVLMVLVYRQHMAQKEIDRQVGELTKEIVMLTRDFDEPQVTQDKPTPPNAQELTKGESVDFFHQPILFPDEKSLGREFQLEGKHEAVLIGPGANKVATNLVKQWTIAQKIFVKDATISDDFRLHLGSERWGKILIHKPDLVPSQTPMLDVLWFNLYSTKPVEAAGAAGSQWSSFPEMMEQIRYWMPKVRIASQFIVTDLHSKTDEPALAQLVVAQVEREYGLFKAVSQTTDGYTVYMWRVHRMF
eukprot:TRINITY_DN3205_c0_g4_i1.p1 TRINITY_DN3205_c0_g4~~TRINITY_DN3205_c0_g4_i1.p1  ORF type:complete len:273 (+),score=38.18 TRINITY_DN3205_c0_g4_i1:63-821(+)